MTSLRVTRDRKYGQASLVDLNFILVDTAGIDDSLKGNTENKILQQSQLPLMMQTLYFLL